MADVEYKASKAGMINLLGSPTINAAVADCAKQCRERAISMLSDDTMDNDAFYANGRIDSKGMARASAYTGNTHGYNACLRDNVLLKAM